jgi:predicted nucleic acid-binding protein
VTKYLLDTNILLRASDRASPRYYDSVNAVASLIAQGHECVITAQILIEFWVVATRPIEVKRVYKPLSYANAPTPKLQSYS